MSQVLLKQPKGTGYAHLKYAYPETRKRLEETDQAFRRRNAEIGAAAEAAYTQSLQATKSSEGSWLRQSASEPGAVRRRPKALTTDELLSMSGGDLTRHIEARVSGSVRRRRAEKAAATAKQEAAARSTIADAHIARRRDYYGEEPEWEHAKPKALAVSGGAVSGNRLPGGRFITKDETKFPDVNRGLSKSRDPVPFAEPVPWRMDKLSPSLQKMVIEEQADASILKCKKMYTRGTGGLYLTDTGYWEKINAQLSGPGEPGEFYKFKLW